MSNDGYNRGRALLVYRDFGEEGLRLLARTDRANADIRYQRGDMDLAIMCIDRALIAEQLLEEVERKCR